MEEVIPVIGYRLGKLRQWMPDRPAVTRKLHFAGIGIGRDQMIRIVRIGGKDNISGDGNTQRTQRESSGAVRSGDDGLAGDVACSEQSEARASIRERSGRLHTVIYRRVRGWSGDDESAFWRERQ